MSLAWVPVSHDENSSDSSAASSRAELEHTHLTVLAAWQEALDAFPEELLRNMWILNTQIRRFIASLFS